MIENENIRKYFERASGAYKEFIYAFQTNTHDPHPHPYTLHLCVFGIDSVTAVNLFMTRSTDILFENALFNKL